MNALQLLERMASPIADQNPGLFLSVKSATERLESCIELKELREAGKVSEASLFERCMGGTIFSVKDAQDYLELVTRIEELRG